MFTILLGCLVVGAEPAKGTPVKLKGYQATTPADWQAEKPWNRLRKYQFRLPASEGDRRDAEVIILSNFGGTTASKHTRWKADFIPPEGKKIADVAKTSRYQQGPLTAEILDVAGTWIYKAAPFDPKSKAKPFPGSRVIWVILTIDQDSYQIRLAGSEKTVSERKKQFDAWWQGFAKRP